MIFSTISLMAIMASLFISTLALANSIMFEQYSYAADNCSETTICQNFNEGGGIGNSQTNNCINFFLCRNGVVSGSDNTQTNECRGRPSLGECTNTAIGDGNTQLNDCFTSSQCHNTAIGDGNTQHNSCARIACVNFAAGSTPSKQSTTCYNAAVCENTHINSNVVANGADCQSSGPDTTTICHPGHTRIITRPN